MNISPILSSIEDKKVKAANCFSDFVLNLVIKANFNIMNYY